MKRKVGFYVREAKWVPPVYQTHQRSVRVVVLGFFLSSRPEDTTRCLAQ